MALLESPFIPSYWLFVQIISPKQPNAVHCSSTAQFLPLPILPADSVVDNNVKSLIVNADSTNIKLFRSITKISLSLVESVLNLIHLMYKILSYLLVPI